ncbi:regulator of G-protein signaling 14 [Pelodytes ibericus]
MFSETERKRSLQFLDFSFWEARNTRSRLSTLRNKFKASKSLYINRSLETREVLAVSDGELNNTDLDGRGSDQSLNSLPSVRSSGLASEHSVASWAVSFERLLQGPLGVEYFTEFLKKEYSAENIYFWKACEKFQIIPADNTEQLLKESRSIYNEFLSNSSLCPVNVDHQAVITEDMLQKPFPDMFRAQQMQIFNLMKFDSYARFVKSPLYQECMLSEVEGRPLPNINFSPNSPVTNCVNFPSGAVKKKLRPGKSLPVGVEITGVENISDIGSKAIRRSFKKKEKKGTCKESTDSNGLSSRRESRTSLNSTASLDQSLISSFSSKSENDCGSLNSAEHDTDIKPIKYCCVYLPDGTASLTAVKPGLTVREMLAGVCEKRGYCPTDVKIYLAGNEQKPLALDQECKVLTEKEVRLENWIGFDLQIESLNKKVRIVSKSIKTIGEALQPTLKKYALDNHHVALHKVGESHTLDLGCSINDVAGQKLLLEVTDIKDPKNCTEHIANPQTKNNSPKEKTEEANKSPQDKHPDSQKEADHVNHTAHSYRYSETAKVKYKSYRQTYDIEGLVELLNRVQSSRAESQRGLLSKEDLELPEFLKLPQENQCHMDSLDDSIELPKTPSSCHNASLISEICTEHNNSLETTSPPLVIECPTASQKQVRGNSALQQDVSPGNKDTSYKEIIPDLNSLHHPSSHNNQISTDQEQDSAL